MKPKGSRPQSNYSENCSQQEKRLSHPKQVTLCLLLSSLSKEAMSHSFSLRIQSNWIKFKTEIPPQIQSKWLPSSSSPNHVASFPNTSKPSTLFSKESTTSSLNCFRHSRRSLHSMDTNSFLLLSYLGWSHLPLVRSTPLRTLQRNSMSRPNCWKCASMSQESLKRVRRLPGE